MTVKELEKIVTDHLIESADVNRAFKDGIGNLNYKMNWVLGLISAAGIALLVQVMRG